MSTLTKTDTYVFEKENKDKEYHVSISKNKYLIEIECGPLDIEDLIDLYTWFKCDIYFCEGYERITFNTRKGKTYISLLDDKKNVAETFDFTYRPYYFEKGLFISALARNERLSKELVATFEACGINIPYAPSGYAHNDMTCDLTLDKFVIANRFQNFEFETFYYDIPFTITSMGLCKTFKKNVKYLKNPGCFTHFVLDLTKKKSLRRTIFLNPNLAFFCDEIKELMKLVSDDNLLNDLLRSHDILELLRLLHYKSGIFEYLYAIKKHVEKKKKFKSNEFVFKLLNINHKKLLEQASDYKLLNTKDRNSLLNFNTILEPSDTIYERNCNYNSTNYSCIMHEWDKQLEEDMYGRYRFVFLKSRIEYYRAGELLNNCLVDWRACEGPVMVVKSNEKIVAAVELNLESKEVEQAFLKNNLNIYANMSICSAISDFAYQNNFLFSNKEDDY